MFQFDNCRNKLLQSELCLAGQAPGKTHRREHARTLSRGVCNEQLVTQAGMPRRTPSLLLITHFCLSETFNCGHMVYCLPHCQFFVKEPLKCYEFSYRPVFDDFQGVVESSNNTSCWHALMDTMSLEWRLRDSFKDYYIAYSYQSWS